MKMKILFPIIQILVLVVLANTIRLEAQSRHPNRMARALDSGGSLIREQAAYDVLYYRLNMSIDTATHSIASETFIRARAVDSLSVFVLDLNSNLIVDSVIWKGTQATNSVLKFNRPAGRIWITLPYVLQKSDTISLTVSYHGAPKVAVYPPWDDGFVWERTPSGEVWAGVACETEGADVWWPCKDHPSDEPDSVDLFFTVPASLTCVSSGRQQEVIDHGATKTFHWHVSDPINNYCVTFYLGPYQKIPISYQSVTGEMIPSEYWFLPEHVAKATAFSTTFLKDLRFFEEVCGPYPFRAEKYGLVEAPYYGMEHQTAIAYGNNFALNSYGFDYIHLHELAHEWWGNLVTAKDWSDVWIHEGFATYMEALFVEHSLGFTKYKSYMARLRNGIDNTAPVAPRAPSSASDMFSSNDVYNKGAWILHTLRHCVGDQSFFPLLRRFAYPDSAMEAVTDGRQCWLATTDDYLRIAEQRTGLALDWFFELYLRQPDLPRLQYGLKDSLLTLHWETPGNLPFSLPVDVRIDTTTFRVDMPGGSGSLKVKPGAKFTIDPDAWILMLPPEPLDDVRDGFTPSNFSLNAYPNPFNATTTIRYELPKALFTSIKIFDGLGRLVADLVHETQPGGQHTVEWNAAAIQGGIYFCRIQAGELVQVRQLLLLR
jgi:aminopeptidase N